MLKYKPQKQCDGLASEISAITIQIGFIFTFLTVFFFIYVQNVERQEFVSQINLIVDDIMSDFSSDINNLIKNQTSLTDENIALIANGIIDVIDEKNTLSAKAGNQAIYKRNAQVKQTALKSLGIVAGSVILMIITLLLLGYCIPIMDHIKEAMIIVVFVGLTEFAFLELVAKNYIAASPNNIKRAIASSINKWIIDHRKLDPKNVSS